MATKEDLLYRLLCLVMKLLGFLPQCAADFCARLLGLFWFQADAKHRQITLANLARAYENEWSLARRTITAKQTFKNIVSIIFELAWSLKLDQAELLSHFTITGLEHLMSAHAKGKGVIGLTCHMGNFEMLTPIMGKTGVTSYAIYRQMDSPVVERFLLNARQRFGLKMIPLRKASDKVKPLLARGSMVGTLLDQNVDWYKGVFTDFFGTPACTNKGLAKLAMDTKTPVVPFYTIRKNRRICIEFLPEIIVENTGDRIRDIEVNTQKFTSAIEIMVRKCPEQYFWVHNRWRVKPFCTLSPSPGKQG